MKIKRTFLITGATKGIGYATVLRLENQGCGIIGIARNKPQGNFPGHFYSVDLNDEQATFKIFEEINQNHQIDGIVNNVGIAVPEPLEKIRLENFRMVLDLNLRPMLQAMQLFTPGMVKRNWGRVVNIASMAVLGRREQASYSAAKAGLIAFTRSCALELAKKGVTINAVAPGPTETERFRQKRPIGSEAEKTSLQRIPMGRFGKPDEVAAAIQFFLSEDTSFITGQTLFVDGGGSIGSALL